MAPVIFGLNLGDMSWGKFKSSYMFGNTDYHLRRTKFVVYQLAMIFCVVSESLGTAALSDYVDQQKYVDHQHATGMISQGTEYNDDYVGAASYNIFAGIFLAFIFGAAFFFDLFWPERHEDRGIKMAWKGCAVMVCVFTTASAITMTIITSTRTAYITGPDSARLEQELKSMGRYALQYYHNNRAIAALVFLWMGWPFAIGSAVVMWISIDRTNKYGPLTSHARAAREGHKLDEGVVGATSTSPDSSRDGYAAQTGLEKAGRPSTGERTYTGT